MAAAMAAAGQHETDRTGAEASKSRHLASLLQHLALLLLLCAGLFGSVDAPCFIFSGSLSGNPKYTADAASHEVGHTLGLMHDGVKDVSGATTNAYYTGHGDWAPIMVRVLFVGRQRSGFCAH